MWVLSVLQLVNKIKEEHSETCAIWNENMCLVSEFRGPSGAMEKKIDDLEELQKRTVMTRHGLGRENRRLSRVAERSIDELA